MRAGGPSTSFGVPAGPSLTTKPYARHPTPCTLHPTPYTLHPTPYSTTKCQALWQHAARHVARSPDSQKATMGKELMAPKTDCTTRIPYGVAFPVTANHAAKGSVSVNLGNTGNLKIGRYWQHAARHVSRGALAGSASAVGGGWTFDHPLFLITPPYIAHFMGACSAKGEWSLFSLSLSRSSLSRLSTQCSP